MLSSRITLSLIWLLLVIVLAFGFGASLFLLWNTFRWRRLERQIKRIQGRSIRNPDYGKSQIELDKLARGSVTDSSAMAGTTIESVTIKNFKNIKELNLDFT